MFWNIAYSKICCILEHRDVLVPAEQCLHSIILLLTSKEAGGAQERGWEGTQPGQLSPADPRNTPFHADSCSAVKLRRSLAGGNICLGTRWPSVRVVGNCSQWHHLSQVLFFSLCYVFLLFLTILLEIITFF